MINKACLKAGKKAGASMSWKKKLATGAVLAGLAGVAIYIINKTISFMATIDNLLSKSDGNYYDWRFGKIYYQKNGSGKPILLIHDLNTFSSSYEWNRVIDSLAENNTVYSIDLLGCGRSDKPNITYTNFLYVQLVTDFIKHIIGEKVNIVCTGESGAFTLLACQNNDSIINDIMLINPTSLKSLALVPTKRTKFLKCMIKLPLVGTLLFNILVTKHNMETLFGTHYFYDPGKVEERYTSTYYEAAHINNSKGKYLFASMRGRFTNMNISHSLKTINNNIFIIVGSGNPENMEIAEQYKNMTPSIEIISVSKTKHLPQLEDPTTFLDHIKVLFDL